MTEVSRLRSDFVKAPYLDDTFIEYKTSRYSSSNNRCVKGQRKTNRNCATYGSTTTSVTNVRGYSGQVSAIIKIGEFLQNKKEEKSNGMVNNVDLSDLLIQNLNDDESVLNRSNTLSLNDDDSEVTPKSYEYIQDEKKIKKVVFDDFLSANDNSEISTVCENDKYEQEGSEHEVPFVHNFSNNKSFKILGTGSAIDHVQDINDNKANQVSIEEFILPVKTQHPLKEFPQSHQALQNNYKISRKDAYKNKLRNVSEKYRYSLLCKQRVFSGEDNKDLTTSNQIIDIQTKQIFSTLKEDEHVITTDKLKADDIPLCQPRSCNLKLATDMLFAEVNKNTVTVDEIIRSIENMLKVKLVKSNRKTVKRRLMKHICSNHHKMEQNKEELKKDDERRIGALPKKQSKKANRHHLRILKSKTNRLAKEENLEEKTTNIGETNQLEFAMSKRRSKRSIKEKHIPSHIRIYQEMLRKKQIENAKIRTSQLISEQEQKINEEDRKRAEHIAKRFVTDREEEVKRRFDDRINLLKILEKKKMELFVPINNNKSKNNEQSSAQFMDMRKPDFTREEKNGKHVETIDKKYCLTVDNKNSSEDNITISDLHFKSETENKENGENYSSSNEEEDDNVHEELEILGSPEDTSVSLKTGQLSTQDKKNCKYETNKDSLNEPHLICKPFSKIPKLLRNNTYVSSPKSILDFFDEKINNFVSIPDNDFSNYQTTMRKANVVNPRLALRNALLMKQYQAGNNWLARELGYKSQDDHIRDCQKAEGIKLRNRMKIEETLLLNNLQHSQNTLSNTNETFEDNKVDREVKETVSLVTNVKSFVAEKLENEEIAFARKLKEKQAILEEEYNTSVRKNKKLMDNRSSPLDNAFIDEEAIISTQNYRKKQSSDDSKFLKFSTVDSMVFTKLSYVDLSLGKYAIHKKLQTNEENSTVNESETKESLSHHDNSVNIDSDLSGMKKNATTTEETELSEERMTNNPDDSARSNYKPSKNAAWRAILKKEAKLSKKLKFNTSGLVDAEAEEEEEEIVGLENFGFFSKHKKKDEEENFSIADDDLHHIVDDLSDNEGDEDAGEAARKALAAKDDKEHHKLIIKKLKEGYDGRRGSVAIGFGGVRGYNRYDQLLAADNREDAKCLGLLNDDEFDSDDELNTNKNEVDDEVVLLDKMLKERFSKKDVFVENIFNDNTDENINENSILGQDSDTEEDLAQERLAQRFAKRARMNRLLETYSNDSEFSQSRLLEEDVTLKEDLKLIKNIYKLKRQFSMASSTSSSSFDAFYGSLPLDVLGLVKHQKNEKNVTDTNNDSSLKLTLKTSSKLIKRKTSFLGGKKNNSTGRLNSLADGKGLSLGHVLFKIEESQNPQLLGKKLDYHPLKRSRRKLPALSVSMKSGISHMYANSLWNKVSVNGFRRRNHSS